MSVFAEPLRFADRATAGRALAARLAPFGDRDGIVLALPRGGVPVAAEVARALGWPLDLMLVRKVGVPGHRELAAAAIAGPEGEALVINDDVMAAAGLGEADIRRLAAAERAELRRRRQAYLGDRAAPELRGRTVLLIDDGAATGATMRAAVRALRRFGPGQIVVALPVASAEAEALLRAEADAVICLSVPRPFHAVGAFYRDFDQVGDDEVIALMAPHPPA